MATQNLFNIPGKNISYLLLCGGGIIAFILLAILPAQRSLVRQDHKIAAAKDRLATQEILYPVYTKLQNQLTHKKSMGLPLPPAGTITMASIGEFISTFKQMARDSHLQVVGITPDFSSRNTHSDLMSFSIQLRGKFIDLRQLLNATGGVAALRRVEKIQIHAVPGHNEFHLKLWLALSS